MKKALIIALALAAASWAYGQKVINGVPLEGIADPDTGNYASVNDSGQLHVVLMGAADANNSTTNTIDANATWTGTGTDISDYNTLAVFLKADQASSNKGFIVQYSTDSNTWYDGEAYTYTANTEKFYSPPAWMKYYRLKFVNGATTQTQFNVHTFLRKGPMKWSSHNVIDDISDEDDAELVLNVNKAKTPGGSYVNIGATTDGNLKIANVESGLEISLGNVSGRSLVHKFGAAPDFDAADGEVTVWDGAEDGTSWELMNYVYSTSADIDSISSSDAGDSQTIEIQGLGATTNLVIQTATLNGQTRVALSTNLYRVFRVKNQNSTDFSGHVFVYTNNSLTAGVPDDNNSIRAVVQPENNQTEMAIYTVPAGKKYAIRRVYAFTAGASKNSEYIIRVYARQPGGVFQLKFRGAMSDIATSNIDQPYPDPLTFSEGTDIEMTVEIASGTATAATITGGFSGVLVDVD